MVTRNLSIIGVVALLVLGVVAMRSFLREEQPPSMQVEGDDRVATVTDVDNLEVPAPTSEPQSPSAETAASAAPQVMHADRGGYELVRIRGGTFTMGSPETEKGRRDTEGPQHEVTVPGFYLGRYPVTNAEYAKFLEANPEASEPPYWDDDEYNQPRQPVVGIRWDEARMYCAWAGLRLPSEAEWEYACRAETTGPRYAPLDDISWGEDDYVLHDVGGKVPNAWGLHDMQSQVWQWCEDRWHDDYQGAPTDGSAWVEPGPPGRVVRGGSWLSNARDCRSACRDWKPAGLRSRSQGFRPAR